MAHSGIYFRNFHKDMKTGSECVKKIMYSCNFSGVLGLTGLNGFAFYVFAVITLWVMFMIKAGPNWQKYYVSRQSLLTSGFFGALFTYVLFWTFIYGMVHVY
jgi:hypothetical protein